jgi:hypothetical protein
MLLFSQTARLHNVAFRPTPSPIADNLTIIESHCLRLLSDLQRRTSIMPRFRMVRRSVLEVAPSLLNMWRRGKYGENNRLRKAITGPMTRRSSARRIGIGWFGVERGGASVQLGHRLTFCGWSSTSRTTKYVLKPLNTVQIHSWDNHCFCLSRGRLIQLRFSRKHWSRS